MSRKQAVKGYTPSLYDLPIINWKAVNAKAPKILPFEKDGVYDELPHADVVVITWTDAEWSALDHVFVHSQEKRSPTDYESWRSDWREYKNADKDLKMGYFAMLEIETKSGKQKVMVYKSECHLSHKPFYDGLLDMVERIADEAKPKQIYTIGTAGGATLDDSLGDVVVTNSGHCKLKKSENKGAACNNQTITGSWYPSFNQLEKIEKELFLPLSEVLTDDEWESIFKEYQKENPGTENMKWQDFINEPLERSNIAKPQAKLQKDLPLYTTDFYYISGPEGDEQWSILEMDDTIVGYAAQKKGVDFIFIRNVSDTVVTGKAGDEELSSKQRGGWSTAIYQKCGFYTSQNSALTTWSAITG